MENLELRQFIHPLLRWWWLLALSTLLASVSSALHAAKQPPSYESTTTVMAGTALFEMNPSGGEFSLASQLATAYADIAKRSAIREATMQALGLAWLPAYTVWQVPRTQLLEISVIDTDPARAQAVADELVNQLILETPNGGTTQERQFFIDQQLDQIETSIVETNAAIEQSGKELLEMFSARQIADARAQIAALESKLVTLQTNYTAMLENSQRGAANSLTVLESANLPTTPVDNNLEMSVLTAALFGFALAAAGAYLLEYLDDTFRSEEDTRRHLSLPALGAIPTAGNGTSKKSSIVTAANSRSPAKDAYGGLRLALSSVLSDHSMNLLLVSSPGQGDGKSMVAANLCVELAEVGQSVILVDADLNRPRQQHLFKLPNQTGLTSALLGRERNIQSLLHQTSVQRLWVLTSGPLPPNPGQILSSQRMHELLAILQNQADIVVLDTPPLTATVDASILASMADGVLLVIAAGRTKRAMARRAVKILHQINANILGVVLNNVPIKQGTYYANYVYRIGSSHGSNNSKQSLAIVRYNGVKEPPPTRNSDNGLKSKIRNPFLHRS